MPELLQSMRDVEDRIAKRTIIIVLLCAGFELLFRSGIGEISVIGVRITDNSIVERVFPAILSYVYFSLIALYSTRRMLMEVYDTSFGLTYPHLADAGIKDPLSPASTLKTYVQIEKATEGRTKALFGFSTAMVALSILLLSPGYTAYALVKLLGKYGASDFVTWTSLIFALFFSLQAFLVFYGSNMVTQTKAGATPDRIPPAGNGDAA